MRGFTLIELLIVVAIIAILVGIAAVNYSHVKTRAKVTATAANIRAMITGIESYRLDNGAYPEPVPNFWDDPFGVVADSAIHGLTTPIAYVSSSTFSDPFGSAKFQSSIGGKDMFGMPISTFNSSKSFLFFSYPNVSRMVGRAALNREGYALVSPGPDGEDSFIVYYPFPAHLPVSANEYGIQNIQDTVYDPTNGTLSKGDIAGFGGDLNVPQLRGGGIR